MTTEHDQETTEEEMPEEEGMTFTEHLEELRYRLFRIIIAAFVGFLICYAFKERLFDILMQPLVKVLPEASSMIFTGLPEAFFTYLKVSLVAGVFLASPYIFYQIWRFVGPGMYETERKFIIPIAFISALFFVVGALFGYFVVFPIGFQFFVGFANEMIQPMPSLREYFSFAVKLLFAFGIAFELPLFIFFLARLGIVSSKGLRKQRKYAVLVIFLAAAFLTPPDIISQVLMSGPLILLYEVSIWVAYIWGRERKFRGKKEDDDQDDDEP
ncbi:Sec-independent protein translocase, TatC subunit [Desulfonatronospira thiodismutans ASO3-1]|uniref:Sec-independent protein translocase protein TatC n=2 Tax=Desulfonatronospira thiodismutans TaxID=488939 RepID=D6SQN6_9BACT|nr:twin-arginine translocase subunit TatC [Desulfonatronospira thiodismutans]EFI35062.1 Sec-independent protein translocase, TatC subunit [Desulfonatronospira thiodismutans ASO3-1]